MIIANLKFEYEYGWAIIISNIPLILYIVVLDSLPHL